MLLAKVNRLISSWFNDSTFIRLIKNASWLSFGTILSGLMGFASIALTARGIGPADFGILVMIMTYAGIVDRLLNFQSWQFLIRNGADALEKNDIVRFQRQVKFSALLDSVSSSLSTIVAVSFAGIAGLFIGWSEHEINLAMAYSITIFFHLSGMPTGVLRLFNQFRAIAVQKIFMAAITLCSIIIAWLYNGNLQHFLLAFALSNIIGNLILLIMGWSQLKFQKILNIWSTPLSGLQSTEPGIWHFVFYSNIESSVKIIRDLDVFLIKIILSSEAVGLYSMARRFADALVMLVDPFYHAVYPEFSKLVASRDKLSLFRLLKKSSLSVGAVASLVWILFLFLGEWIANIVYGTNSDEVSILAALCMIGSVIWAFSQTLTPVLYNMGRAKVLFKIHLVSAILYIIILTPFTMVLGIYGSGIAYALFFITWCMLMFVATRHSMRSLQWEIQ